MSLHSTVRRLPFTRPLVFCATALYLSWPVSPASTQDDDPSNGSAGDPYGYGYGYYGDDGSGGGMVIPAAMVGE